MKLEQNIENEVRDLIKNPTNNATQKDSQEPRDGNTEIRANSSPLDERILYLIRKGRLYELVAGGPFNGITPSALDFIYKTIEDKETSKNTELRKKIEEALSRLEEEIFKEDKEATLEKFSEFPLEIQKMIWKCALLDPKVVRIGILPTERNIGEMEYLRGEHYQTDKHTPMLLERNHILESPPCPLLSVNKESRKQALEVHGLFWEQKRPCEQADGGYVSFNHIYVNWEIDTVWLNYNLAVAWRDNKMDPSDRMITPMPSYEKVRRLAIPAESIEWPCERHVSDIGLAIADFTNLKDLAVLVPQEETVWSDPILVPTLPAKTFFNFLDNFGRESLGIGFENFIDEDRYEIGIEDFDMRELRECVYCAFQRTLEEFYASDREDQIAAGHIRDLSTWEWPDVQYMETSTIKKEKVRVKAKDLLDALPAGSCEIDEEDTNGRRSGVNLTRDNMMLSRS
ncbi:hypothetical protein BOTCAL_0313g00040 [Botryotinia calthae]|uniref:2EXR domain-containing protein n=1 Tax=Botryotinia calthae TaxID=38488 RepID=A0A4Y8CTZ9_9HELO|nr:hypothetical protein BOTCAL_0313g00040 [Botryotinia calthae]